jgi:uncharacterized protein
MRKRIVLATASILALTAFSTSAQAAERYVTVSGVGTVHVTPDAVRIDVTTSVLAASSAAAQSQLSPVSAAVRAAFLAHGITSARLSTRSLNNYPQYNYTDTGSVLVGYKATQSFEAIVTKASTAGAVVDAVVAAGGNNMTVDAVSPFILDPSASTESARASAVKNAKAKANSYAKLLGVSLGSVTYLEELNASFPTPVVMAMAKSDAGATTVDLGQQDVTVSVNVRWAIK